jgi:ABC-type transporter Mla MlaB component
MEQEEPEKSIYAKDSESVAVPTLQAVRAGEWLEAGLIHAWMLEQIRPRAEETSATNLPFQPDSDCRRDLAVDLEGIDYLEADALQVLLAAQNEQIRRGQQLHLRNISSSLQEWFVLAGAADLLKNSPETATDKH